LPREPLPADVVVAVEELLAAGLPDRLAAKKAEVSRATVMRIRRGTYRQPKAAPSQLRKNEAKTRERCPGCGGLITIRPCRYCRLREILENLRDLAKKRQAKAGRPRRIRRQAAPPAGA